jgi:hypothetical protein
MNARIKELWDQAAKLESDPSWEGQTKFMEKFAELIVQECAGIYSKIDNGNLHMGTDNYLEALHKTFRS